MLKTYRKGWHVLYVRSCQEQKVHQLLQENNFESFLPLIKTIRQWSDRKKTIFKPLFPSYVFVNINSSLEFYKALASSGACAYIRFGKEYALVKDDEIQKIKFLVGEKNITDIEISLQPPKIGEVKKIAYGSLKGLECEVLKVNNVNKIIVQIGSLHQNITASIPSYYFEEVILTQ